MKLADTFYIPRSGRYTNPKNTNDCLPIVYGDLTDGSNGNWELPCIDTVNFVYCFAAHEVLSVAGGNSISIYADDVLVAGANYTFDESDNYETQGLIAKVTFTSDQSNKKITARGKGKVLTGTTLMTNIVDILNDFLMVWCGFTASVYESTSKSIASNKILTCGYKAAGVIDDDDVVWDVIQDMVASFLGSVFVDGSGLLVISIDDDAIISGTAGIINKADISFKNAVQKLENIINQCPADYGRNYCEGDEFKYHADDIAYADLASQAIYGVRKPKDPYKFYWCRDLATVYAIQTIIVSRFASPLWEVTLDDNTLKRLHIDAGDIVSATLSYLYDSDGVPLINHHWRVLTAKPDTGKGIINYKLLQTGRYDYIPVFYPADGSVLADGTHLAGLDRDMTTY